MCCTLQTYYLLHEEGFFVGASSGLNVAAAVQVSCIYWSALVTREQLDHCYSVHVNAGTVYMYVYINVAWELTKGSSGLGNDVLDL